MPYRRSYLYQTCPRASFIAVAVLSASIFLLYLPRVCQDPDRCLKAGKDEQKDLICNFCDITDAISSSARKILNYLRSWLPASSPQIQLPTINDKFDSQKKLQTMNDKFEPQKSIQTISDKVSAKPTEKPSPAKGKEKKKKKDFCPKISSMFKKVFSRKSKSKELIEAKKSAAALVGCCPRCVDKGTPCPTECPKKETLK